MKRSIKWLALVSLLLIVVMSFALVSCGGDDDTDTDTDTNSEVVAPTTYKITLKQEGQEDVVVTVERGKTPSIPDPKPVAGYTVAWDVTDFSNVTSDITVNAVKTLENYTITYEANGGKASMSNPTKYNVESGTIILGGATLDGYDFVSWYEDIAFTKPITQIDSGRTGNITLYAQYTLERYDIVYNLNGGRLSGSYDKDFDSEHSVTLPTPKRAGYTFAGWYTDAQFTNGIVNIPKGTKTAVAVYANWVMDKYTISYNIGSIGTANSQQNPSEFTVETPDIILEAPTTDKAGWKFDGWYTSNVFSDETILENNTILNGTISNVNLYAKWSLINYTITYELNGGEKVVENPDSYTVENVDDKAIALAPSTQKGYEFKGWFLDAEFTGDAVTTVPATTLGGITLYAKWDIITYNIEYVLNGGTNAEGNKATYTVEENVTFADPTTTADTYFIGWFTDEACTEKITSTSGKAENLKVYARWFDKEKDPTMKFDASLVESAVANEENGRKDQGMNLFDGNTKTAGLYNAGDDWYGAIGDMLTITFKEEITIKKIDAYVAGNWTLSNLVCYDANGNEVATGGLRAESVDQKLEGIINLEKGVKVKTITIEIAELKWNGDVKTHKISELEIFVANPDYKAPTTPVE